MPRTISILFLSANPDETTQLKLPEEFNLIDSKIQASKFRDQFHLEQRHAVSLLGLQAYLLKFKPNIVHFSGHGSPTGKLVFENSDGEAEEVSPKALSELFRIINEGASGRSADNDRIQCVVLSACYSLEQAKAIAQHVDFVIGLSDTIEDNNATNFAASFYQALGYGKSMKNAFDLGRNQLGLYEEPDERVLNLVHRPELDPTRMFLASEIESTDEPQVGDGPEDERRSIAPSARTRVNLKFPIPPNEIDLDANGCTFEIKLQNSTKVVKGSVTPVLDFGGWQCTIPAEVSSSDDLIRLELKEKNGQKWEIRWFYPYVTTQDVIKGE